MNKTIVFDLGGVLIDWDPKRMYRKMIDDETEIDQFLATVCTHDWNIQQDAGRPLSVATEERIQKFP